MSKIIKMVAVVGGDVVTVGRCHPGQARLLQKQDLAEWKEGKLWLKPPAKPKPENIVFKDGGISVKMAPEEWTARNATVSQSRDLERVLDPQGNVVEIKPIPGSTVTIVTASEALKLHYNESHAEYERELDAIDPDGILRGSNTEGRLNPSVVTCVSLGEWFKQIKERRKQGHELGVCDNPKSRHIGFIDVDEELLIEVGLSAVKLGTNEDYALMGDPAEVREWMRSSEGRCVLVGDNSNVKMGFAVPDVDGDVPEELWESPPPHPLATKNPDTMHVRWMLPALTDWGTFQWPTDREVIAMWATPPREIVSKTTDGDVEIEERVKNAEAIAAPEGALEWGYFRRFYMCLARIWKVGPKYILEVGDWDASLQRYMRRIHGSYGKLEGAERRAMLYAKGVGEKSTAVTPSTPTPPPA